MNKSLVFFNRERFEKVVKWCQQNGVVPEESVLRVSEALQSGVGTYMFDVKNGKKAATDVVLNRNDLFIPFGMGLFIAFDGSTSAGAPDGKGVLYPYAPKAGTNNPIGFANDDIDALYNGLMQISFGQVVINSSFPLINFKSIPETQNVAIYDGTELVSANIQPDFDIYKALYPLAPAYYMQGTEDINIRIDFNATGSDFTLTAPSGTEVAPRLYLYMSGVLVKNAAEKVKNNPLRLS